MSMSLMVDAMKLKIGNPTRKLVLIKLADNANDHGECWPSYNHIADQCEISRSSAMRHVKALIEMGLVSVRHRKGELGNSSNIFTLDLSNPPSGKMTPPSSTSETNLVAPVQPPLVAPVQPRTSQLEPVNEPKDLICVCFEKFWKSFPKKMNKKKALSAFKSAFKKQDLQIEYFTDMLIADVNERISRNQLGFDKLHATTYLNNERWNDEHETNQPSVTQSGYKPNSIEAYNERLLAKYGHTATPVEREINPVNDFGLDQHQVSGSVYEPMDAGVIASDMGAGDHGVDR